MRKLLVILVVLVVLVACTAEPQMVEVTRLVTEISEVEVTRLVTEISEVEVTRLVEVETEVTRIVEVTPEPTPTKRATATPTYDEWVKEFSDWFIEETESIPGVDRVDLFRVVNGVMEVELSTSVLSEDYQPRVSWDVVSAFSGFVAEEIENDSFVLSLKTYSGLGEYRYQSETDYDTFLKLNNRTMSYDEWVEAANAGFR